MVISFVMICFPCKRGLHKQCKGTNYGCECRHTDVQEQPVQGEYSGHTSGTQDEDREQDISEDRRGTTLKRDDALKDQQSTGRKRAARQYPFLCTKCSGSRSQHPDIPTCSCDSFSPAPCEWRGFANNGGGAVPVLGCTEGFQTDRHHGPDKAVTNNERGNVHRICSFCHHLWHDKNNKEYDWRNTVFQSHAPRLMTEEEKFLAAVQDHSRREKKLKRIRD